MDQASRPRDRQQRRRFLLITAIWPIVASIVTRDSNELSRDLSSISPVVVLSVYVTYLSTGRYAFTGDVLWATSFWAIEIFTLAMAILWLTVPLFERCFERMPDRRRQLSNPAMLVIVVAAMTGAGSLAAAVDRWIVGVKRGSLSGPSSFGFLYYGLVIATGMVLAALDAVLSRQDSRASVAELAPASDARSYVARRWWKSFRLIALLAIGPALLALALATAAKPTRYEAQYTTDAKGLKTFTGDVRLDPEPWQPGELRAGERVLIVALLIVTILAHGGAAISAGVAFSASRVWSRRAIAAAFGVALLVALFLPICVYTLYDVRGMPAGMWSFVSASTSLFASLATRESWDFGATLWTIALWDAIVALFAFGLLWRTVSATERAMFDQAQVTPALATEF